MRCEGISDQICSDRQCLPPTPSPSSFPECFQLDFIRVLRPCVWLWGLRSGQGFQWVLLLTLLWGFSPFFPLFCLLLLLSI